jgi:homoserine O-succinyltransferase
MPVCLDNDRIHLKDALEESAGPCLRIGLINNMPDGALQATERQFVKLLDSASGGIEVRLSLYALPDVPRTEWGRSRISRFYSSLETLWNSRLDALIVTGTEPVAPSLTDEPYWRSLTKVIEWAEYNTISSVWSCLAAHAAVLHTDGIQRLRLRDKRFGVFRCNRVSEHLLTSGVTSVLQVPHSRWNDIAENDLMNGGYRILTRAGDGGVDSFAKQGKNLAVFLQGHPEYEVNTLLFEYRRDIGRYLRRERGTYPEMPEGYFDSEAVKVLAAVRERALSNRCEELLADFPFSSVEEGIKNKWRASGARLYSNWLSYLTAQKQQRAKKAQSKRRPHCESNVGMPTAESKGILTARRQARP